MERMRIGILRAAILMLLVGAAGCGDDDGFLAVPGDPPFGSPAPTQTPILTPTVTQPPVATPTATQTPAPGQGPEVTFFGVARADDILIAQTGVTSDGVPIYLRPFGAGFRLVVEGGPGASNLPPGDIAFDATASAAPDLQIVSSRPLGNGSTAVCDRSGPEAGGVPAVDPPDFGAMALAAINDFGCRFLDGRGEPFGRTSSVEGCIQVPAESGTYGFAELTSQVQFCSLIDTTMAFPSGDTRLTVRLLDRSRNPGEPAQIVVRVP